MKTLAKCLLRVFLTATLVWGGLQSQSRASVAAASCNITLPNAEVCYAATPLCPTYFARITISGLPAGPFSVANGNYFGWCIDEKGGLRSGVNYCGGVLLNSLDAPAILVNPPVANPWNYINWIINNKGSYNSQVVQHAIWYFTDSFTGPTSGSDVLCPPAIRPINQTEVAALVADALANGGSFVPGPGQKTLVAINAPYVNVALREPQRVAIEVECPPVGCVDEEPTITCPPNRDLGCNPTPEEIAAVMAEELAKVVSNSAVTPGTPVDTVSGCIVTRKITYTATNLCDQQISCTQELTWKIDKTAPVFTGLPNLLAAYTCISQVPAAPVVTANDDCDGNVTVSFEQIPADLTGLGSCNVTITRIWKAIDDCRNEAMFTQVITVNDDLPPTVTAVPTGGYLGCNPDELPTDDAIKAGVTAMDNCGAPTVLVTHVDGGVPCARIRTFSIKAIDSCGNSSDVATVVFTWKEDLTDPVLLGLPASIANYSCLASVPAPPSVTATDNCDGNLPVNFDQSTETISACEMIITRTWSATDSCGNDVTFVQTITVLDDEAPEISGIPGGGHLGCSPTTLPTTAWVKAQLSATDNCGAATIHVTSADSGDVCAKTREFTIWAVDACGNRTTDTTVTYTWSEDSTPPTITKVPAGGDIGCADLPTSAQIKSQVEAGDNCGTPDIEVTHVNGGTECAPTRTFTIVATDACGNKATRTLTYVRNCAPCVPASFNFNGSTATSGTAGNIRTFTVGGVSVKASAFSRTSSGSWATAYLGQYSGGLGVTDTGEGDGSGNAHTVDNVGRNNYVLFEFNQPVVLKTATLGYVVTDSDMSVWIGSFANPYANHLNLNDGVLGSFSHTEQNTGGSSARTATLNAGEVIGNAIVIAARVGESSPNDYFKIKLLDICVRTCEPPPPPCLGSICGVINRDCDANGSLSGEAGLGGVTVYLKNTSNQTLQTTTTAANGSYCFNGLAAGTYVVEVAPPADYIQTVDPDSTKNHKTQIALGSCQDKIGVKFGYTGTKPSVKLTKTGPAKAKVGETITYTFVVENTGNTCLYGGMSVTDPMFGGEIWHKTPVNPGEKFTFTKNYVVKSSDPKPLVNKATAWGHPPGGLAKVSHSSTWTTTIETTTTSTGGDVCPSPWSTKDIGAVAKSGSVGHSSGKFTIKGSGEDIWNNKDEFRYVYQAAYGDCSIVARVPSIGNTHSWAKAGLMIRESLSSDSKHASIFVTPSNGVAFQYRNSTGGSSSHVGGNTYVAPEWLKIVRTGSTFTAYRSGDGSTWTLIGSTTVSMGSSVYIGLAVTSHNDGVLCTAEFDSITAKP